MRAASPGAPARFAREQYFPKGWEASVAQFVELFHPYGYIYKPLTGGSWYSADEKWKLTDTEILKAIACVHPKFYIGCRAGKATRYAVLDIDAKSKYHTKPQLDKLLAVLADAGLSRSSLYRSSYSGGWHLYLFFDEPINSAELRRQLVKLLSFSGFELAKGTLEVFPNRENGSLGMGLRLPLQPGFAWLSKTDLEVDYERAQLSATKALELFVDALESDANSFGSFRKLKQYVLDLTARKAAATAHATAKPSNVVPLRRNTSDSGEFRDFVTSVFGQLPPGLIPDNWYKGRLFHLNGLSGPSQRAHAIICLGHYFFYGDPSRELPPLGYGYEQERAWALKEFLAARHNGQSKDINKGRSDAIDQVDRAANWRPAHAKDTDHKKYSAQRPISWIRENANRQEDARARIQRSLDTLKAQHRAFTTVELQELAECSRTTLYKHEDIWRAVYEDRKGYRDLAAGFFANCTHEYNDAVGADSPEIKPPSAPLSEFVPPGLLACRRVAYEISMRSERDKRQARKSAENLSLASHSAWSARVKLLTAEAPSTIPPNKIKALLLVLTDYLGLAPNKEEELLLQSYICQLREQLSQDMQGPHSLPPEFG